MVKVAGSISKSGEVMKSMNDLMQIDKLQAGMRDLAKEMTKAGLIEEMVDDAMDNIGACAILCEAASASSAMPDIAQNYFIVLSRL
jgi:division protein CdvB (Snf7/Vps24/ESCRT-III family)